MGATNHTTNYLLSQFLGTDKPAWLQDYNGDMSKIDAGINSAKIAADNAALAASAAQGTADSNTGSIATLTSTVNSHTSSITNLSGNVNTINSLIGTGSPTAADHTIIGAINDIDARVTGGYIIEQDKHTISVSASTDTYLSLCNKLLVAIEAEMAGIDGDEYAIFPANLDIPSYGQMSVSFRGFYDPATLKAATMPHMHFTGHAFLAGTTFMSILVDFRETNASHFVIQTVTTGNIAGANDRTSVSLTDGDTLTLTYYKVRKV